MKEVGYILFQMLRGSTKIRRSKEELGLLRREEEEKKNGEKGLCEEEVVGRVVERG